MTQLFHLSIIIFIKSSCLISSYVLDTNSVISHIRVLVFTFIYSKKHLTHIFTFIYSHRIYSVNLKVTSLRTMHLN